MHSPVGSERDLWLAARERSARGIGELRSELGDGIRKGPVPAGRLGISVTRIHRGRILPRRFGLAPGSGAGGGDDQLGRHAGQEPDQDAPNGDVPGPQAAT